MVIRSKRVFIVHGRNWALLEQVMAFLRAVGLSPISWGEAVRLTGMNSAYIGQALDAALSSAQAIIVLLSGDDELLHNDISVQPRANVLFEAGMAFTRITDQTILVDFGTVRLPDALKGRWRVRLSNHFADRMNFIQNLQSAGCAIDLPEDQVIREVGNFDAS